VGGKEERGPGPGGGRGGDDLSRKGCGGELLSPAGESGGRKNRILEGAREGGIFMKGRPGGERGIEGESSVARRRGRRGGKGRS